jgi:hypothetical protein
MRTKKAPFSSPAPAQCRAGLENEAIKAEEVK